MQLELTSDSNAILSAFKQIETELNARLPYKRLKLSIQTKPEIPKWSKGDISTLLYGVLRFGEKEFGDLMGTSVFMRQEYERKIATETIDFAKLKASSISLPDKSRHSQT